jgi:general secretion pathway protein L
MSLLVVLLPPRDRLGARAATPPTESSLRLPSEWVYGYSADERGISHSGQAALAQLPKADRTVLVLAEADVSWHRIAVPRAPASRLRAALAGVMEEALLDDDEALHFALGPGAVAGSSGWVAVTDGRRLAAALAAIEATGRSVDSAAPSAWPGVSRGHFHVAHGIAAEAGTTVSEDEHPWLTLSGPDGVACLRLAGALARALVPADPAGTRWTANPAAAQAAELLLGFAVPLCSEAERALEAALGGVNLRQFDLVSHHRGTRALRDGARRLFTREWRPVRLGLLALVLLQLVGLNAYAWQQRQALQARREAMVDLVKATHPGVRVVLDAPLQMQRETDRLRAAAGQAGAGDLEALMAAAAAAWPDGAGPVQTLRFEGSSLTLGPAGWGEPQLQQFRERLRGSGYAAESAEGRVVLTRSSPGGSL